MTTFRPDSNEWTILRPNLEYSETGKIKPCTHISQLNPIEQILLELLEYYIKTEVVFEEQYMIGDHGLPLPSELSFWGEEQDNKEEEDDDYDARLGGIWVCFYSIVNWFKCIHSFNECNDKLININEMKTYLNSRANDKRERDIILSRYTIIYELTESQIMLYIRDYYYMRFRGPLLDNLITREFSPK
jgi:hypothetical protein